MALEVLFLGIGGVRSFMSSVEHGCGDRLEETINYDFEVKEESTEADVPAMCKANK